MVTVLPQYPHYLYVMESTGATRAENGDFTAGTNVWSFAGMCREETNGKGTEINTADMKSYKFASLIQLPVGTARVNDGTQVIVSNEELDTDTLTDDYIRQLVDAGTIRIKGESAKFDDGRLHCRLWL